MYVLLLLLLLLLLLDRGSNSRYSSSGRRRSNNNNNPACVPFSMYHVVNAISNKHLCKHISINRQCCVRKRPHYIRLVVAVLDSCASSPCLNGGTCSNSAAGYVCSCADGFNGVNCDGEGAIIELSYDILANIMRYFEKVSHVCVSSLQLNIALLVKLM